MSIKYSDIVPWGRSFEEYIDMFLLSDDDLKRKIIGVGDGPASFNTQMYKRGVNIISVDPIYQFSEKQLRKRIKETYETVIAQTSENKDKFVWTRIPSLENLMQIRMASMDEFCQDYELGKRQERYVNATLPTLPFADKSFDLVLSSHLLFFYSANRDLNFHIQSVKELLRIGSEVRIFPIVDLNSERSPFLAPVIDQLSKAKVTCTIEKVPYHFQKTGNEMLRLKFNKNNV
ncbi:methyltransferase domain-containing protein [bacterium]|nr:methyltransferase domain-containing protein [bacterium]